jgi:hypothetical protein
MWTGRCVPLAGRASRTQHLPGLIRRRGNADAEALDWRQPQGSGSARACRSASALCRSDQAAPASGIIFETQAAFGAQRKTMAGAGMTTTAKEARRAHSDTNATDYSAQVIVLPVHAVTDLDETYKPQDLIDALRDLHFDYGPKVVRIDRSVRDYLLEAVRARSGCK